MRTLFLLAGIVVWMASCSTDPRPPAAAGGTAVEKLKGPKPEDESRRFPKANLVETKLVEQELMGKAFMPGGTLASYKKGKSTYEMFLGKMATSEEAAILLIDWRKALTNPKLVPSFGGYFGEDAGTPVFVFTKGAWIAGIKGLSQSSADLEARTFAGQIW